MFWWSLGYTIGLCDGIQTPKTKPPKSPQQDSPVPSLPRKQTARQPTPGPSGTQWSEELFHEPTQTKEPPIPGLSPSCQPPEDNTACEPEPEVAPTQSMEEPFARPATPCSIIIIEDTPVGSPPSHPFPPTPLQSWFPPSAPEIPITSSPRCKAPLIPTMRLARNSPTYDRL
ncbi:hypothetical protein O181_099262 [Austropuccinia psidii MF-1]|uniref:Uncharacterized protein n=1 Tax=Austropuccinia psidii MF-1 TaxID=1389203 RepID=A0A9Q3JCX4_9BASI|nr:hypothetical protein [Austropuccinia psidii MF-1]